MIATYPSRGLLLMRHDVHELFNRWDSKKCVYVPIENPKQEFARALCMFLKDIAEDPHSALRKYRLILFSGDTKDREQVIRRYRLNDDIASRLALVLGVYTKVGDYSYKQGVINREGESPDLSPCLSALWTQKRLAPHGLPRVAMVGIHLLLPAKK